MKPSFFATAVLLAGWITAPAAQQKPAPVNEPAHKVYVLTGCLEGGPSGAVFKLTRAASVGQTPPAPVPASTTPRDSYELLPIANFGQQGIDREGLQSHVGRRVQVTVQPVETSPATPSPAAGAKEVKPDEAPPQRYTVTKIGQLAESCS